VASRAELLPDRFSSVLELSSSGRPNGPRAMFYVEASHQGYLQGPDAMPCIRHGGSAYIMAPERRVIVENSIVGAGVPLACAVAMANVATGNGKGVVVPLVACSLPVTPTAG
jgi:hypothetical protein